MGDPVSAIRLLGRAREKLADAEEGAFGLEVAELCKEIDRARRAMEARLLHGERIGGAAVSPDATDAACIPAITVRA